MRIPSDLPPRRPRKRRAKKSKNPNRGRILLIIAVAVLFVLFLSARGIAGFYTDYLWFDSLGYSSVFTGVLGAKIALAVIFTALFFVMMLGNLFVADKLAPTFVAPGPEGEFLERYRQLIGGRTAVVRVVVSLLFALIAGVGTSSQWKDWILFTHRVDFGTTDKQFGKDVGFYVFQLPFISFVLSWFFAALVIVLVVTAVGHYLNGGIRLQVATDRVTPHVKAHLSVLLGVLALVKAIMYWFDRYALTFSDRGAVSGATYTDVNAKLPAITLLMIISLTSFVLLIVNIRRRGWVLPVLAVGLWAVIALTAGTIYPAVVQRFYVQPSENRRELPYIDRNIEATRQAMGLDEEHVTTTTYELDPNGLKADGVTASGPSLSNLPLLDPTQVLDTFQADQSKLGYYRFDSLDVDRYKIDGVQTQVLVGARELVSSQAPQRSWVGTHLIYTHGSGVVIAPTGTATSEGRPVYLDAASGAPSLTQPELYFGEQANEYAIVNTNVPEASISADGSSDVNAQYKGTGGVQLKSRLRRFAFALRFSEPNLLLSGQISNGSRILYTRNVRDRVQDLAPFLSFDSDAYPVVRDGKVFWVIDAYTTTNRYPNAQKADNSGLAGSSGLRGQSFNYARNSVKAVVDAYNGDVSFYVVDDTDPMIRAYQKAFPDLFEPKSAIPTDLAEHFRYPTDLFRVQTNMWGRYHLTDPSKFYGLDGAWIPARDPAATGGGTISTSPTSSINQLQAQTRGDRIDPYYAMLPQGEGSATSFVQVRTFVPNSENDQTELLAAIMTASGEPGADYGKLRVFEMPTNRPNGPAQVLSAIKQNQAVSSLVTLLGQQQSNVKWGQLAIVPLENSLLYVQPLYVSADNNPITELRKVIISFNGDVFLGDSLSAALKAAFGVSPVPDTGTTPTTPTTPTTTPSTPTTTPSSPTTTPSGTATAAELIAEADKLVADAEKLPASAVAEYVNKLNEAIAKYKRAAELGAGVTSSSSTTTTAPPSTITTAPSTTVAGATTTTKTTVVA